jgi:hypothetical protein
VLLESASTITSRGWCPSRALLEVDHIAARALGGPSDVANLRVLCRAHNRLHAEDTFGRAHVARAIDVRRRTSPRASRPLPRAPMPPPSPMSPSSLMAPSPSPSPSWSLDVALRGLVNLGFAKLDAQRVLADVSRRHANDVTSLPAPDLLREAIAALT